MRALLALLAVVLVVAAVAAPTTAPPKKAAAPKKVPKPAPPPTLSRGQAVAAEEAKRRSETPPKHPQKKPPQVPPTAPGKERTKSDKTVNSLVKKELQHIKRESHRDEQQQNAVRHAVKSAMHSRAVNRLKRGMAKQTRVLKAEQAKLALRKKHASHANARRAQKEVMNIYHQEAQKLLGKGDGPTYNPFTVGAHEVMSNWLASDPLLQKKRPKRRLTMLDNAVDEAQRHAQTARIPGKRKILLAVANRIQEVSASRLGQQLSVMEATGSLLSQKKARAAMRLIIYQAYNDGFGKDGNPYQRAFLCQKALKTALDMMHLAKPSREQKKHLCRLKLYEAESKLRIEAAAHAALLVAGKSASQACNAEKEAQDQMKVARFEVTAVKSACNGAALSVPTAGTKHQMQRRVIRKTIAAAMLKQLHGDTERRRINKKSDAEINKIMDSAKKAWADIHQFGNGSHKSVDTKSKASEP